MSVRNSAIWAIALLAVLPVSAREPLVREGISFEKCPNISTERAEPWRSPTGHWFDATGERNGTEAFAIARVKPSDQFALIEWDVTSIVRGWEEKHFRNDGLVLRSGSADGRSITRFWSQSASNQQFRPVLKLMFRDRSKKLLYAVADLSLDCQAPSEASSSQSLTVSRSGPALLLFSLPEAGDQIVSKALLQLTTTEFQFGEAEIGVYRFEAEPDKKAKPTTKKDVEKPTPEKRD